MMYFLSARERTTAVVLISGLLLFGSVGSLATYDQSDEATDIVMPHQTLGDFAWENISMPSFELSLDYVDVSIPGPPDMELVLRRRYLPTFLGDQNGGPNTAFGQDWSIDNPYIYKSSSTGLPVDNDFGCIGEDLRVIFYMPGGRELKTVGFDSASKLRSGALLAFDGGAILLCEASMPVIIGANGIKYSFGETSGNYYRITSQSDRFGNVITYNYDSQTSRLTSISRDDGAQIVLARNSSGKISAATYHGRTVTYSYKTVGQFNTTQLHKHIDEEARATEYFYKSETQPSANPWLSRVVLATGGQVSYNLLPPPSGEDPVPPVLWNKTISGPDVIARSFSYSRMPYPPGTPNAPYGHEFGMPEQLWSQVTEHDHTGTKNLVSTFRFHNIVGTQANYGSGEVNKSGRMISQETKLGEDMVYEMNQVWSHVKHGEFGCSNGVGRSLSTFKNCGRALLTSSTHTFHVVGGTDSFVTNILSYDDYGLPRVIQRKDHSGSSRYERKSYSHDMTHWLIGRPTTTEVSLTNGNWTLVEEQEYHPATAAPGEGDYKSLPSRYSEYGVWQSENDEYHASGELKHRRYNGTSSYEEFTNYELGIAKTVTVPRRYEVGVRTRERQIDDFGNVTSETDFAGTTVSYSYDGLNRHTGTDYADARWKDITKIYDDLNRNSKLTQGDYQQWQFWDGLGRSTRMTERHGSEPDTERTTREERNKQGLISFRSFPSRNPAETNGRTYTFDALNRKTGEFIAETGTSRTWTYLAGHKVRYQDGLGNQTTASFESFGDPDYSSPTLIAQPEGITTSMVYNVFGKVTTSTQDGIVEKYLYDSAQRLCKRVRPDVYNMGYGYNARRQAIWVSRGNTGSSTACGGEAASEKLSYQYDNRSNVHEILFPDGSLYRGHTMDAEGNVERVDSKDASWVVQLNSLYLVEKETLLVSGRTFDLDWEYNDLGDAVGLIYPNSQAITFEPNALGQPSRAGAYATGAKYHPTGKLESFTYGNGVARSVALNGLGLPSEIKDFKGSTRLFEHDYQYNSEFDLEDLFDRQNDLYSVNTITYDGARRFRTANGQWGATDVQYDKRGNIKSMAHGGNTTTYHYTSNRLTSTTGSVAASYTYDGRGNITNNGINTLSYDVANQLISASGGHAFEYDGLGLRVEKRGGGKTINFVYGADGKLYHESTLGGTSTNYIYLDGTLVAKEVF